MRAQWKWGLSLSLGLLANVAWGEDVHWRPVRTQPAAAPAVSFGQPVAAKPAADAVGSVDSMVRPVGFSTSDAGSPSFIVRGQAPDLGKPMPPANGQQKSSDKPSELHPPKELRETLSPSPKVGMVDPGDYCVSGNCSDPTRGGACCGGCGWGCNNCGDGTLWWVNAEYLLWWTKNGPAPALVTTGPTSTFGVLGASGTQVLFGGPIDYGTASGGRFGTGLWFCESQVLGVDGSFLFLGDRSSNFLAASNSMGSPVISRPFVGAVTGQPTVEQVAFPGEEAGSVHVHSTTELWGAETNLRWNPCCLCCTGWCGGTWRMGFLAGYRFMSLKEKLGISEDFIDLGSIAVTRHQLSDEFRTSNMFNGGQLGTIIEWKRGCWSLDMRAKVALGATHETVNIAGSEVDTLLNTGAQASFNSGLLALPSNSGHFSRDVFSVIPEVGVNLGYQICPSLRLFVGYSFLYWSRVARPGAQIDTVINTSQQSGGTLSGPARPQFAFHGSDFWAQGVNFGLELRY